MEEYRSSSGMRPPATSTLPPLPAASMRSGETSYTDVDGDNLLGLAGPDAVNAAEMIGIERAEHFLFTRTPTEPITTDLIRRIHREAFGHLYAWAGAYRTINVLVGPLEPPPPPQIQLLMKQFEENLCYRLEHHVASFDGLVDVLAETHHRFVYIHPFRNGNGRTARLLCDLIAVRLGEPPFPLYVREGDLRMAYIGALREADHGRMDGLRRLIAGSLQRQRTRFAELCGQTG